MTDKATSLAASLMGTKSALARKKKDNFKTLKENSAKGGNKLFRERGIEFYREMAYKSARVRRANRDAKNGTV